MRKQTIRLGLVSVSSPLEFGSGEASELQARLAAALTEFGGFEVRPFGQIVDSSAAAAQAGCAFQDQRVDAICALSASWFEDYLVLDLLEECNAPLILWARPGMETGSLCGMQQLGYMLQALGHPYCIIYGQVGDPAGLQRASDFGQAAAVRRVLRRARLGILGHRVDGMTETTVHELAMKRIFGSRVVGLDTAEFRQRAAAVPADTLAGRWEESRSQVGDVKVDWKTGIDALKLYVALKETIQEKALTALAVGCYPHLYGEPCLGMSLLNEEGIPMGCEGDVVSTLGMLIMMRLSGQAVNFAEFLDPIPERDSIMFSHCGACGFSVASSPAQITLAPIRLTDSGLCCLFPSRPGTCTMINLGATNDGYRMAMLYGEALETTLLYRGAPIEVHFEADHRDVMAWVAAKGLGHHWVAAYGDLRQPLQDLAAMTGCRLLTMAPE